MHINLHKIDGVLSIPQLGSFYYQALHCRWLYWGYNLNDKQ